MTQQAYSDELRGLTSADLVRRIANLKVIERGSNNPRPLWQLQSCWAECLRREREKIIDSANGLWQQGLDIVREELQRSRESNLKAAQEFIDRVKAKRETQTA